MLVVDVMGVGREFQLRLFEQALLFTVIPFMDFLVGQQLQPFGEA